MPRRGVEARGAIAVNARPPPVLPRVVPLAPALPTRHASGVHVLKSKTDPRWLEVALSDLDALLIDHAHLEKKAAASAMSLVQSYPDHDELVRRCTKLAQEELRHFQQVHQIILERGRTLSGDKGDPYARALLQNVRDSVAGRKVDRLLIFALIEARSCERLDILAGGLSDPQLARFYAGLVSAEAAHFTLFVDLAERYDESGEVATRLEELAIAEAKIIADLPLMPRLH